MYNVKRLFFVPVGLPGMGKSTLAKHIRQATLRNLQGGKGGKVEDFCSQKSFQEPVTGAKRDHTEAFGEAVPNLIDGKIFPDVDFEKISYDRILGDNTNAY
jgi:tRNA uridine 5-carbamoylmethylation protein Kti12